MYKNFSINKLLFSLLTGAFLRFGIDDADGGGATDNNIQYNDDNGEAIGTGNDARIRLLNQIGDNADRARAEELADLNDDGSTSQFTLDPVDDDEEAKAAREAAEAEAARAEAERVAAEEEARQAAQVVAPKIKVNGQEMELTPDLIEKAQKIASADVYLRDAAALRESAAQQAKPVEKPQEVENDLASVARAIQMGTEEEAVSALQKLMQAVTPSVPKTDEIIRITEERLTAKNAFTKFEQDYSDVMSDQRLRQMVFARDAELVANGDRRSYEDRYKAIGEEVRGWISGFGGKTEGQQQQQAAPTQSKEQRKASAPVAPKQASGKTQQQVQEEQEESTSEVIAKMAQNRGGPQWMMGGGR